MTAFPLSRSIITRLVVVLVLLTAAVIQLLWYLTDTSIRRASDEAQIAAVNAEMNAFLDIHDASGPDQLATRIENRLEIVEGTGEEKHYLLSRPGVEAIAGDPAKWDAIDRTGTIELPSGQRVYSQVVQLDDGLQLIVARELTGGVDLLSQAAVAFFVGGAALIILTGLSGLVTVQRLARRIDRINSAFRGPDPDLVAELARDPGSNDEIGELTRHSAKALDRVGRLLNEQRDLSARVAHELRTPLNHLDDRLVKAVRAAEDPDKASDIRGARADLKQVVDLLESVLDISANESLRGDMKGLKEVELSHMVARICELYVDSVDEAGLSLVYEIEPGVEMLGEEQQLARVLTNLLDNAMKYVPDGGTISVRLESGPVLWVGDDGPGIPIEARESIFERFRRGAMTFNSSRGAGLGLALARSIAERHSLTLTLEDSEAGALFRMGPPVETSETLTELTSAAHEAQPDAQSAQ